MTEAASIRIVTDEDWQQKLTYAVLRRAFAIYSENAATPNHAARAALAKSIVLSPGAYTKLFALAIGCDDAFLALTALQGIGLSLAAMEIRVDAVYNTYT